jgi:putative aldouronate transport system permease protein
MLRSKSTRVFAVFNILFLTLVSAACVIPFINIIAVSLSKNSAVAANWVKLWPVHFTSYAYEYTLANVPFWRSFVVAIERVAIGGLINMFLVLMTAYPLSKEKGQFKSRTIYVWLFFFTMLFSGGLIPLYVLMLQLRLLNTIWALVLPSALPVFSMVLMLNFFRQIPRELEEAALIDGANHFRVLWGIYVPCSLPAIATIGLFTIVWHWNAWFDGLIFMNSPERYPLQSYLQTVIIGLRFSNQTSLVGDYMKLRLLSDRTLRAAQIIIATIPILAVYPFLQRYFISGIVLGSVKG